MRYMKSQFTAHLFKIVLIFIALILSLAGTLNIRPANAATAEPAIQVGSELEFPPYAFVDEQGQASGFSVDLIKAVADVMGLHIVMNSGTWDTVWKGLVEGSFDILPIVAKSPLRKTLVDFSLPHTETFDAFFVRKGNPAIQNIAAAQGKTIVVMRSDAAHHELLERKFQGQIVTVETIPQGLALIASGKHDAMLCSKLIGILEMKHHDIIVLKAGAPIPDYKRVFAFGVKKGADELLEMLNQGLLIVKTSGSYDRIYEKWLGVHDPWLKYRKYGSIVILIATGIILTAVIWLVILRRQVKRRTKELAAKNDILEQEILVRRRIEDELQKHRKHLETLVEERTTVMRESEQRLNHALSATTDSIWDWNLITGQTYYSPRWYEMLGYENNEFEMNFDSWKLLCHPDDFQPTVQKIQTVLEIQKEKGYAAEFRMKHKNGAWIWISGRGNVVERIKNGKPLLLSGTNTDITERIRAEEILQESGEQFRSMFENHSAVMLLLDPMTGKIVSFNRAAIQFYGYTPEEISNMTIYQLSKLSREEIDRIMAEVKSQKLKHFESLHLLANGSIRNIETHSSPIPFKGKILMFSVINDITQRKQTEEELLKSKKIAESATSAKSEFLANMSHEIRTPMNPVINMTRLLLNTELNPKQREYAETVMSSSEILLDLINDILDFSKIEAGKMELEHIDFDLLHILHQVESILRAKAEEKGISIIRQTDPDLPSRLMGDPVRLRQILFNFANNAVKFTHEGRITIRVLIENEGDTHVILRFEVADTGVGIPKEHQNLLFKPFSQADASVARQFGGTGLGLAISRQLAELMGGEIGVDSRKGKGSTFFFRGRFEKAGAENQAETGISKKYPTSVFDKKIKGTIKILLAEDNAANQKVALAILNQFGLSADVVSDGNQAVEALKNNLYDLVLMDVQMPETDGLQAARLIRNPESGAMDPFIPIVALTANATREDRGKCMDAGMDDYISKPVDPDELFAVILSHVPHAEVSENEDSPVYEKKQVSPPDSSLEIFNSQEFLNRLGGNEKLYLEIIKDMPQYISEVIGRLKIAIHEKNAAEICLCAHSLKGMSSNISAKMLRDISSQVEIAAREGKIDAVCSLSDTLEQEAAILLSLMSDMFPEIFQTSDGLELDKSMETE